ncbi:hypothetical protein [Ruminococcus sp. Marseille-P6503]|uniref:hypothetical protein n=1 Tax=Ruminococcus sp. Marseille-P6503 TaxID=2364796 RepID=UPI000F528D57|nr:hypothetical protein [Ruminococcus sp. Marseille-P6503]
MEAFRTAILTASIVGIVSAFADFAAPGESMKKQLKMIITLVLILSLFTPFIGADFRISVEGIDDLSDDGSYESLNRNFTDYYLEQTNSGIERALISQLEREKIYADKIRIYSELNEYNSIEITKAEVYAENLSDDTREKITDLISAALPDAEIVFVSEVDSEAQ